MNKNQKIKVLIGIVTLLLVSAVTYGLVRDNDPYKYYTGLGKSFSISPNNEKLAFSYYVDGNEAIYTSNIDGSNVEQVIAIKDKRLHHPTFSTNGKQLLFLAKNTERANSLYVANVDGSKLTQLTEESLHVEEAIFSPADNSIYFIGIDAEELNKEPGESSEGFDLFSVNVNGSGIEQLTNNDYFSMSDLFYSSELKKILFNAYGGNGNQISAYSIEDETIGPSERREPFTGQELYNPVWSKDENKLAFTAVSEESKNSSLFKYELFLTDTDSGKTTRLTELEAAIDSPVFFNDDKEIAFLENTNWPSDPAKYRMHTIHLDNKEIETINLDAPHSQHNNWLQKNMDRAVNGYTLAILYTILFGLITMYQRYNHIQKIYLPAKVSFGLAIFTFISSFVVAMMTNPWFGIGIGMLAAVLFACSVIVLLFAFAMKRFGK